MESATKDDAIGTVVRYNKLVRDRIPAIIHSKGSIATFHFATEDEYRKKLFEKLQEEIDEFFKDPSVEELADIMEVVRAVQELMQITNEALELMRQQKEMERGGFKSRIILEQVQSTDL